MDGKFDSVPDRSDLSTLATIGDDGYTPVAEASGIALRSTEAGTELLVIGDREWVLATASLSADRDPSNLTFVRHDVSSLFPEAEDSASQWEAVDVDSEGRVFVLEERPGAVHVLTRELDARLHTIELDVPGGSGWRGDLQDDWDDEPNSRGEGLVLGDGGHLLVLKEKQPSLIVEFGPPEDDALGYFRENRVLGDAMEFPLPSGETSRFVPLAVWEFKSKVRDLLTDMSGLTVGPDGHLYLISGEARVLARIEDDLDPEDDGKLGIDLAWKVPKRASNPEGLVVIRPFEFLVVSDEGGDENLFYLEAD